MKWNTRIKGMTLIETVVAVAIVAILSAVAIPAFGTYTTRSRVSECLVLAGPAQLAVSMRSTRFTFSPTRNCASITIADDGVIVANTSNTGAAIDPVIQLTPTFGGSVRWHCGLIAGNYADVPPTCRNSPTPAAGGPIAGSNDGGPANGNSGTAGGAAGNGGSSGGTAGPGSGGGSDTGTGGGSDNPAGGSGSDSGSGGAGAGGPSAGGDGDQGGGSAGNGDGSGGDSGGNGNGQGGSGGASSGGSAGGNTGGGAGGNTGGNTGGGGDGGATGSADNNPSKPSLKDICTANPRDKACANVSIFCRYFGVFCPWK